MNSRARHAAAVWPFLTVFCVSSTPFGRSRSGRATLTQFWDSFFFKSSKTAVFRVNSVESVEIAKLSSKVVFLAPPVQPSRSFGPPGPFRCGRLAGLIPNDPPQAPRMRFGATLTQFWVFEVVSLRPFGRSKSWRPPSGSPKAPTPFRLTESNKKREDECSFSIYIYA